MPDNMQHFTHHARHVLSTTQQRARLMKQEMIRAEHLLLGLMYAEGGVAYHALLQLGWTRKNTLAEIENLVWLTQDETVEKLELSADTQKALELAVDEARQLGNSYIGTEHLLLALTRQPLDRAHEIMEALGAKPEEIRNTVHFVLLEPPDNYAYEPRTNLRFASTNTDR